MPKAYGSTRFSHVLAGLSTAALLSACSGNAVRDLSAVVGGGRANRAPLSESGSTSGGSNATRPSPSPSPSPIPTPPVATVTGVDAGHLHTCARTSADDILCFGSNSFGQLGDGSQQNSTTPRSVSGISDLVKIHGAPKQLALGTDHSCLSFTNGRVACWGSNKFGQLGVEGYTVAGEPKSLSPVLLPNFGNVSHLVAGNQFTCARTAASALFCWGKQYGNTLKISLPVVSGFSVTYQTIDFGIGYPLSTSEPTRVLLPGSEPVTGISAGGNHACAVGSTQRVFCFGNNDYRQLGVTSVPYSWDPVQVPALGFVNEVGAGGFHTCARVSGDVVCWGLNSSYQVSTVSTQQACSGSACELATTVDGISSASRLSLGSAHSCELNAQGKIRCWGNNVYSQLGTSQGQASFEPQAPEGVATLTFTHLSAGTAHTCAINSAGVLLCWGNNTFGQQGPGGETGRLPAAVALP